MFPICCLAAIPHTAWCTRLPASCAGGPRHSDECTEFARTYHLQTERGERGASEKEHGGNGAMISLVHIGSIAIPFFKVKKR